MKKLIVIIVNFNERENTLAVLKQLKKNKTQAKVTTVVVDNNSGDGSVFEIKRQFPKVILIQNTKNMGFAKGVNRAIRLGLYQKNDYFLLLNPDTEISFDFLESILNNRSDVTGPVIKYKHANNWIYDLGGKINWLWGRAQHNEILNIKDQRSKKDNKIDYLSGCCLLIKRKVFEKIGLFDERFFLYWEDTDFCVRAQKAGFSIRLDLKTTIAHRLKGQEKKGHKPFFNVYHNLISNFLFILKHQKGLQIVSSLGYFAALIIKVLLNEIVWKITHNLFFFSVLALAILLRTYNISSSLPFTDEIGRDYLSAKRIAFDHQFLLLGPPSSHTWLFHGPFFYYLLALSLLVFNASPFSGYFLILISFVVFFFLLYGLTKLVYGKSTALVSLLFMSVFPQAVALGRIPAHYSLVPLFSLISFMSFLLYIQKRNQFWLTLSGIAVGLAVQLHLSSVILVFFSVTILLLGRKIKQLLIFSFFFAIPLIPLLIYDFGQKFNMLRMLILWFPYRVLRFSWLSWQAVVVALLAGAVCLWWARKVHFNRMILLPLFLVFSLLLLFLHGNPPTHYFYFMLPQVIILASLITVRLGAGKNIVSKLLRLLILVGWSAGGLYFFFKAFLPAQLNPGSYPVPLFDQEKAVILILSDASGQPFKLKRFGDLDIFQGYLDNYRYLVWWLSGKEEDKKAGLTYIIYEDMTKFKKYANLNDRFFSLDRLIIEKKLP